MDQINRAISILKSPQTELAKVKTENINKNDIIRQYIAILALIPAIAYIIGYGIVGLTVGFGLGTYKLPIEWAVLGGIITYILSVASVYISGIVINALALNFASKQNDDQAMKLAAYSATAGLVGGIFNIIPMLGIISLIFSLYGLYILYLGIPVLMETPQDKVITYTIVIIVVTIVIAFVVGAITSNIIYSVNPMPGMMGAYRY
ncbi:MAG: YIP1 family protein [Candidatus Methanoperedens sp.]|nr:YIP1 family protein [Candidatus Methanoperedens sp.]